MSSARFKVESNFHLFYFSVHYYSRKLSLCDISFRVANIHFRRTATPARQEFALQYRAIVSSFIE